MQWKRRIRTKREKEWILENGKEPNRSIVFLVSSLFHSLWL